MNRFYLFLIATALTSQAATITGISSDWENPFFFEVEEGSNVIENVLPGGGGQPLFYTMRVPDGLEITELNILAYSSTGGQNGGSLLAMQIGETLVASPADIEADFSIRINNILFSDLLIGRGDVLASLNAGEQLQGAPTLIARDYALFINENTIGVSNVSFRIEFVAETIPEPSSLLLLALSSLLLARRKRSL